MVNSSEISITNHVVFSSAHGVSVVVCLLAAILVLRLKTLVYRLALYQVLSALAMASVGALQVMRFINYADESSDIYLRICTAIGFLEVYTEWMKLLFTTWVTFHLFCFAVFHKNMKKLEALYVVTSLLVPALIAALLLVTQTYGSRYAGSIYMLHSSAKWEYCID
eukprot:Em0678g2a